MGTLFGVSRFWDAVSDPMSGYLSDRTRSRMGRRRSWMLASAVPVALGIVALWSPPSSLGPVGLVAWMAMALLVYETASTAFFVPHGALGVELTPNYHERTRLFGYRHVLTAFGLVTGLGVFQLMSTAEDARRAAFIMSVVFGTLVGLLIVYSSLKLRERPDFQGRGGSAARTSFGDVVRNPHARLLLFVYGIETFGVASIAMLVPYVTEYGFNAKEITVPLIATYFVPQFVFTPMWIALSRRVGKKPLWLTTMAVTCLCFAAFYFVPERVTFWLFAIAGLLGLAAGCGAVVAPSIKADVIDWDEYHTGERKEGAYLALWNFVRKSAGGITAVLTGFALELADFKPNVEQTEEVKLVIRVLFSLVPASCYLIGTVLFARFAFNEKEHAQVRLALDQRARDKTESGRGESG
jgi:GPH family glycoside/pentoside/hexuronide:cation symporter